MYARRLLKRKSRAFIVLISVIITSIILTIGIGIINLGVREFLLSNIQRESLKAFYTADTMVDCIFAYDVNNPPAPARVYFASPSFDFLPARFPDSSVTISCGGVLIGTDRYTRFNAGTPTSVQKCSGNYCIITELYAKPTYPSVINFANGTCSFAEVRKIIFPTGRERTEIFSRGINSCSASKRVERALLLRWESR
jgi:preprotein translocase subunit SecE